MSEMVDYSLNFKVVFDSFEVYKSLLGPVLQFLSM